MSQTIIATVCIKNLVIKLAEKKMKEIEINGIKETIVERSDYPIEQCKENLADEVTAILGYGPQGRGQGLNMRDLGFNVILGLRRGRSWDKAIEDGWVEGERLSLKQKRLLIKALYFSTCFQMPAKLLHGLW
ncbi:MAG: hypothetical protein CM1200mP30_33530 [Pseudomonadota bacterium]|nr:MAG: hypothetical protein CM1200mP30_33530 [Pseudomonadota bacterium]